MDRNPTATSVVSNWSSTLGPGARWSRPSSRCVNGFADFGRSAFWDVVRCRGGRFGVTRLSHVSHHRWLGGPAVRQDVRRSIRSPPFVLQPLLKLLKPNAKRIAPVEPLCLSAPVRVEDDGHVFQRLVVVAGFEAQGRAVTRVEPDHRKKSTAHSVWWSVAFLTLFPTELSRAVSYMMSFESVTGSATATVRTGL